MLKDGDQGVIVQRDRATYAGAHQRLGTMIEKIGLDEFKQAILGSQPLSAAQK